MIQQHDIDYQELLQKLSQKHSLEDLKKYDLNKVNFPSRKVKNQVYQKIYYLIRKEIAAAQRKKELSGKGAYQDPLLDEDEFHVGHNFDVAMTINSAGTPKHSDINDMKEDAEAYSELD